MKVIVYLFSEVEESKAVVRLVAWAFALRFRTGIVCEIASCY